jgi:hypothetical protein
MLPLLQRQHCCINSSRAQLQQLLRRLGKAPQHR